MTFSLWCEAYDWLCRSRLHWPADDDVWDLRWRWQHLGNKAENALWQQVTEGQYRLSPMRVIEMKAGDSVVCWSAADALVLKYLALHLQQMLPVHPDCHHVRGHGGVAGSRMKVWRSVQREVQQGFGSVLIFGAITGISTAMRLRVIWLRLFTAVTCIRYYCNTLMLLLTMAACLPHRRDYAGAVP